jgi:hypothetical protein
MIFWNNCKPLLTLYTFSNLEHLTPLLTFSNWYFFRICLGIMFNLFFHYVMSQDENLLGALNVEEKISSEDF